MTPISLRRSSKSVKPVAVLFSSEGCPSCQVLKPQIKVLAEKQAGRVDFYEMDVTHTEAWKEYNVMGIPTVIVFRGGKPMERFSAMLRVDELEKTLSLKFQVFLYSSPRYSTSPVSRVNTLHHNGVIVPPKYQGPRA